ncbi:hypothetical protein [Klebsiella pneumoniae]|uniref:hypothetical protein n=1 Tax=Klebsiella pneumoniae TaxID=573 RepID=UPI001FAD43FA|nr:hypothetical protein [Klebsiella pneumoniae]MDX6872400.1 hypothetical protein [Klebsiella pneumoniae]
MTKSTITKPLFAEVHCVPDDYHFAEAELDRIIAGDMFTPRQGAIMARELKEHRQAERDSEPVAWGNGCDKTVPAALRYLAENKRPSVGSSTFNTEHLYQLAREIELMAGAPLYRHAQPTPVVLDEIECDICGHVSTDPEDRHHCCEDNSND